MLPIYPSSTIVQIQILPQYQNPGIGKQILSETLTKEERDNSPVTLKRAKRIPSYNTV